jgi:putative ABC transport system permease protein
VPALRATRPDVVASLKEGAAGSGSRGAWLRGGLVVGQLALSFALLAITALLVRSLWAAQTSDPGYATETVSTLTFSVGQTGLDNAAAQQLIERLARDTAALPGVEAAALASNLPFGGWSRRSVYRPQPGANAEEPFVQLDWTTITPNFHATIELPLLAGEPFSPFNSGPDMPPVVIISQSAATLLFGSSDPIGQLIPTSEERLAEESLRVIGVVADARMRSLQQAPRPSVYAPISQSVARYMTIFARASSATLDLGTALRQVLAAAAPDVGVLAQGSLHERMGRSLRDTVTVARLAGIFAVLAAVLAAMGLYGVASLIASNRRHEIGVRMALGAQQRSILGLVIRQAAQLAVLGVAIGIILTLTLEGAIGSLLYEVSAGDPATLVVIAVSVVALAMLAALAPAYRATRVSPVTALRQD